MLIKLFLCIAVSVVPSIGVEAQGKQVQDENLQKPAAVTHTMRNLLNAASGGDLKMFRSLTTPGFYAFDSGKRIDGDGLMQMVMSAQAKGMKFVWNLTKPDVRICGDHAWIAYENVGSIQSTASTGPAPIVWLESAFLERRDGAWRVSFLQSARKATPSSPNTH